MRFSSALSPLLGALVLAAACASQPGVVRQPDGNWKLSCDGPLSACLVSASQACPDHGYDVLLGKERRDMEGGSPYTGEFVKSEALVRCRQAVPLFGRDPNLPVPPVSSAAVVPPASAAPVAPAAPARPAPAPVSAPAPRCVPGTSLACATPSGCTGAQVCASDGASFGPCECAQSPAAPDAGATR